VVLNKAFHEKKIDSGKYIINTLGRTGSESDRKKIRNPYASKLGALVLHPALYRPDHVQHTADVEQHF
jgi:hypothetical protein